MAPNLATSQRRIIHDMMLNNELTAAQMADAAGCSVRAVKYIRSNLRASGSVEAPWNSTLERWKQQFVSNLCGAFPTGECENWAACQALYAHAKAAVGQQPKDESSLAEWATVLYRAAWFAERIGNIANAEMLATKAIKAQKKVLVQEHEDTLWSVAMVGLAYKLGGRWDEAEKLPVQVMETRKTKLGADHLSTLTSMHNLAYTQRSLSREVEAVELMRKCVQLRQQRFRPNHPDLVSSLATLAQWEAERAVANLEIV